MTDHFIDKDETQFYGPYAAKMIRRQVVGTIKDFDVGLEYLASSIEDATAAIGRLVGETREVNAQLRKGTQGKVPALQRAQGVLGRFSTYLDAQPKGEVDRKVFFTADGTAGGVGKSAPKVLLALTHLASQLKKKDCKLPGAADWHKEVTAAAHALAPVIEHSDNARTDRGTLTPELDQARAAWLQTYNAAKCGVECVLRLTGRLDQLSRVFHDLAVPAGANVTEEPPEPAPAPAGPASPSRTNP